MGYIYCHSQHEPGLGLPKGTGTVHSIIAGATGYCKSAMLVRVVGHRQ